jgi:adenosylcobinamide kinase / adenosylcobinamide-phosphate guanylyltransferase
MAPPESASGACPLAQRELVLGGQRSGKSRRAEALARVWLDGAAGRSVVFVVTATAGDEDMRQRIERHRRDRALFLPEARTVEAVQDLPGALRQHAAPDTLLVVDCLTLWLTHHLMPLGGESTPEGLGETAMPALAQALTDQLSEALQGLPGAVVLVSNETGLGVVPLGRAVRAWVDALGRLNQAVAAQVERVTLMVAGCPLVVKGAA